MKRFLIAAFALVVLAGIAPFIAPPIVRETIHNLQCSESAETVGCIKSELILGHIRSKRGDLAQAQEWYERGAKRGDAIAMFHLAWVHEQMAIRSTLSTGGLFDRLWNLAKLAASPDASEELADKVASMAANRNQPSRGAADPNWSIAKHWYKRSAKLGFAPSMNNLGQMALTGMDGQRDESAAFRWHLAAAQSGNPVGSMNVAIAYSFGHGVNIDREQNEKWSTWTPVSGIDNDLSEPTLARTRLFGSTIPAGIRENIRIAARLGNPFKISLTKMKPDPQAPVFRRVGEQTDGQSR